MSRILKQPISGKVWASGAAGSFSFILLFLLLLAPAARGQGTRPLVAIHDSELTRALDSTNSPAVPPTPNGATNTGLQWWPTNFHYHVMPESVKEALRSDGTAFAVISDTNITAGALLTNGQPKYPILISLASEAIRNDEIAPLTNYVAAGGFLFIGSSSFTRNTNGTTRTNFAFATEMGLNMVVPGLTNWAANNNFSKQADHRLTDHIPGGLLTWRIPSSAEENSWGISPSHTYLAPHLIWQVQATTATVLAQGDSLPFLLVKPYGKGYFIYYSPMQPLLGHGGWAPGMYAYGTLRKAIEWAFESSKLPVTKLSPWPFPYDSAFMVRHDLENYADEIANIRASAIAENSVGAKGDYFFCTGTLRQDMTPAYNTNTVIANLRDAMTNYGATVSTHNGGLRNPNNASLTNLDYDFWHWGPDEAMDITNTISGYANGKAYAKASLSNSFNDIEGWLPGIMTNTMRLWVTPYFNGTREDSMDIQAQLGVKITGDIKLSPFPGWMFSTKTAGLRYPILNIPVSDWYVNGQVAQSIDALNLHTSASVHALVDYYYGLGALINLYSHTLSTGQGPAGALVPDYINYCLNTNLHPRLWAANSIGIYSWWLQRSNAQISVTTTNSAGGVSATTITVTGATDTNTAVELVLPAGGTIAALQVKTNGVVAPGSSWRTNGQTLKVLVGTSVTNAVVSYVLGPKAQGEFYTTGAGQLLTVPDPGVLSNDSPGLGGSNLTAVLISGVSHGTLNLSTNGGFTYTPSNAFSGFDGFTYQVNDTQTNSASVVALISVTPPGSYLFDDFARPAGADPLIPWVVQLGDWAITNGVLMGASDSQSYGFAYITNSWTDYSVQAQVKIPTGGYGGGIGGRLNTTTGTHYAAWIYPENSVGGSKVIKLIKFTSWSGFTTLQQANLTGTVADAFHTVKLTMNGVNITVSYDGTQLLNVNDGGMGGYSSGGVNAGMWTFTTPYNMQLDSVLVTPITTAIIANNDSYSVTQGQTLTVNATGVLGNDSGGSGTLSAALISGPSHGNFNLASDGSFTYTPTNNYVGQDSFTYQATDGLTNSPAAAVTITVNAAPPPVANNDSYTYTLNTPLVVPAPGVLGNDTDPNGSNLVAVLVNGPTGGTLTLNSNGGFTYTPANGFIGNDGFTYRASDGLTNSGVATVNLSAAATGTLFSDDFSRNIDPTNLAAPWVVRSNNWTVTGGLLQGGVDALNSYGSAYVTNSWSNYYVQARLMFGPGGYGGGIGGRLNSATGARYVAWVYPSASSEGTNAISLVKFSDWTSWGYTNTSFKPIAQVSVGNVGTIYHTVRLAFHGSRIAIYYDGVQVISVTDNDTAPVYTNGGISLDMYTSVSQQYVMSVDDVVVNNLVINDSYNVTGSQPLTVSASGVLINDTAVYTTNLAASLVSGPTNGTLTLNSNGGFSYTMTNSASLDTFTYQAVDGTTNIGSATVTIGQTLQSQTITFDPLTNKTYGDSPFGLSATASSGLPVSLSVLSGPAVITNTTLTITGAGTVVVRASQAGNSTYAAAPNVDQSFVVNKASLTVTANNQVRLYGVTNPVLTAGYTGFVNGENSSVLTGNPTVNTTATTNSPVGTYAITVTNGTLAAANYSFAFVNGTLTVNKAALTVTANNQARAYGATNPVLTVSYSGFVNGQNSSVLAGSPSVTTTATTNSSVGSYTITVTNGTLASSNYNFSFVNGTLTVNKAALTVTANNQARLYGATNPVLTASYTGFVNGENSGVLTGNPTVSTTATTNSSVGSFTITVTNGTLASSNYNFSFVNGTLTVNKAALTVTANNQARLYGATNPVLTVSYTGFVNGESSGVLTGNPTVSTTATTNSSVGSYTITVTNGTLASSNYNFSFVNGTLTVNKAELTVTANNQARAYGATNPVLTVSYSGFVNGQNSSVLAGSPSVTTTATTNSLVGSYTITVTNGTLASSNYNFSFVNGALTVNKASLTVSADNQLRLYGVTNPVLTVSYSGFVNAEDSGVLTGSPTVSTTATTNSTAGSYAITITNGTLASSNYNFSFVNGTLTVNKVSLTVTADDQVRLYGATNPVLTASYGGFVNGENSGVLTGGPTVTTAATTNSTAGSYPITVTNGTLASANYNFSFVNGTLTVNKVSLTVTADDQVRLYGATNPVLTASYGGFVNGETSSVLAGAPSVTTTATTNSPVASYIIAATNGSLASANYNFSFVNGTLTVNKAVLTVAADNKARAFGLTNPVFTASYSGFMNGDTTNVLSGSPSVGTTADTNSPVGNYAITIASGSLAAANYSFNLVAGTLSVGQATITVSADNLNRAYGATNPVLTVSYSGFVNGDSTNVLSGAPSLSTTADTNSPVGAYAITVTQGSLVATNYLLNFTNGTLTMNPAVLTVTVGNQNRLYGATNPVLTASFSGFVNGESTDALAGAPALSTAATTNSPAGGYPIAVTNGTLTATNYSFAFVAGTLTVNKASLTVTADNQNRVYGATNPVLTASYSGFANGETASVLTGSPTVATTATTNSAAGSYAVTVTNGTLASANYNFSFVNGTLTVNKISLTVTADNQVRLYGATNPVLTASYGGFVNGETSSVLTGAPGLATAATTNSPAGAYPITVTNGTLASSNYNFSFVAGALTVNKAALIVTADDQARLYGATNPMFTVGYTGFANGESAGVLAGTPALSTLADTNSPAGNYSITVTNGSLASSNYNFSFVNGTLTVNKASLTVTADTQVRLYGATNPVLTVSYGGFVNGENSSVLAGSPTVTSTAATNSPAGSYSITVTNGTLASSNYNFSFVNGTLTVNKAALTVTADNQLRLYGATNPVFTVSYGGFVNGENSSVLTGSPTVTTTATTNSAAGSYSITVTNGNLASSNYNFSFVNGSLTVNKAALTVTADNQVRLYGATNPVLSVSYSGFVNGENSGVLTGSPTISTTATTNSIAGSYAIIVTNGTLTSANYNFSFVDGTLTVNKASLIVTADNQLRLYGATNPVLTASYSGFANGENSGVLSGSPTVTTAATTNSAVGSYAITVTNGSLASANYTFSFVNGTLTVNKASLTVTADNQNRLYGATNPVLTVSYSGFANGEAVGALSGLPSVSTSATTNSGVGPYAITVTNGTLASANYSFSFVAGVLTINPAPLTVTADNKSRLYGATNPVFTASYSGFVNGETTNVLSGDPSLSTTAVTSSPAGSYLITAANGTLAAANYSFSFSNGVLTVIASQPTIQSISRLDPSNIMVTWTSVSNATYRLQYVPEVTSTNWQSVTPDVTATNTTASAVDNSGDAPQRLYRVFVVPQ